MKIFILDGGPRKEWNTATMCKLFAEGAMGAGAEVETIRLYDLDYRGCHACFACRLKGGKSYARCGYPDGIRELLERISEADGVVFASPVYFGGITAQLRGFMERLLFPFIAYDAHYTVLAPKRLETAMIYTMNVAESTFLSDYIGKDYSGPIGFTEQWAGRIFTMPERICAFDTYQFSDYSKYETSGWDEKEKAERRLEVFPDELRKAYEAGVRMVEKIKRKSS